MYDIEERLAVLIDQDQDLGKEVELVERRRDGNQTGHGHDQQRDNCLKEQTRVHRSRFIAQHTVTTATLGRLEKKNIKGINTIRERGGG